MNKMVQETWNNNGHHDPKWNPGTVQDFFIFAVSKFVEDSVLARKPAHSEPIECLNHFIFAPGDPIHDKKTLVKMAQTIHDELVDRNFVLSRGNVKSLNNKLKRIEF